MKEKMTYKERKDITSAIVGWINFLVGTLWFVNQSGSANEFEWKHHAERKRKSEALIEVQLAASAGVLFCQISSETPVQRWERFKKDMETL